MKLFALDDKGKTYDRYTILNEDTGDMVGASDDPFHPMGYAQYVGNVADNYWNVAYGYGWHRDISKKLLKKRIKVAVDLFKADCAHVGVPVPFESLPIDVQKFAKQSL